MDDELSKPYKKIAAAEELVERSSLLDYYVSLYKRKYKAEPIFPVTAVTQTQIKNLHRIMKDRARDTITAYFAMHDDWFSKQHHSLECLLKNLSKVNVHVSKQTQNRDLKNKIRLVFSCDACWKSFELVCDWNEDFLNKPVFCSECGNGAKVKRVSKDEFKKAIGIIGQSFREVGSERDKRGDIPLD